MRFHGYFRSSSAYRCRIAFNLKGVSPEFNPVHLPSGAQKAAEFSGLNPQKLVPALETDAGEVLTQSLAIIEWLDEEMPEPALLPKDAVERAQVRAFAQVIACETHPLQNLRVLKYLREELSLPEEAVNAWLARWLTDGLEACEGLLSKRAATPYAFGEEPSLADICLVPQVFSAQRFGVDISHLTRINAIYEHCQLNPAFAEAAPARQPDFQA